jgi:hypothetical protein
MKGGSEHDEIEAALRTNPALEGADLDGYALLPCNCSHSRIGLNGKNINPSPEQLFGYDPGTRTNIEHLLGAP